jgi:hypothetical protein
MLEGSIMDLLAFVSAFAASAVLGVTKKYTGVLDGAIGKVVKPLQPAVIAFVSLGLPYLASVLHLTAAPDASTFVAAPTATILAVTIREVLSRLKKPNVGY